MCTYTWDQINPIKFNIEPDRSDGTKFFLSFFFPLLQNLAVSVAQAERGQQRRQSYPYPHVCYPSVPPASIFVGGRGELLQPCFASSSASTTTPLPHLAAHPAPPSFQAPGRDRPTSPRWGQAVLFGRQCRPSIPCPAPSSRRPLPSSFFAQRRHQPREVKCLSASYLSCSSMRRAELLITPWFG